MTVMLKILGIAVRNWIGKNEEAVIDPLLHVPGPVIEELFDRHYSDFKMAPSYGS